MKCSNCGSEIDKSWNFCPSCGNEKRGFFHNPFKGFGDRFLLKSFDKVFKQVFDSLNEDDFSTDSKNFVIHMSNLNGEPEVKIYDAANQPVPEKVVSEHENSFDKESGRLLKNVLEPEASISSTGNSLFIELKIPSVKSINDVEVTRLGESVEIRAYGKDRSYFKVLTVPDASKILKKELRDGKLFVELG